MHNDVPHDDCVCLVTCHVPKCAYCVGVLFLVYSCIFGVINLNDSHTYQLSDFVLEEGMNCCITVISARLVPMNYFVI